MTGYKFLPCRPEGTARSKPGDLLFSLPNGTGIRGSLTRNRIFDELQDDASANSARRTLGSA